MTPPPPPTNPNGGRFGDENDRVPITLELNQNIPYVWLYAIDIPSSPRTKARLTPYMVDDNTSAIQFERTTGGDPLTYSPADIAHSQIDRDNEGSLASVRMGVSVRPEVEAQYDTYGGLIGERVRIVCILKDELPDGIPLLDDRFVIEDSWSEEGKLTFVLSKQVMYQTPFPDGQFHRVVCGHEFGGPGCGYDTTRAGSLQTCSKREDGPNGCIEHGDDEVAAGLERQHPQRILRFPGILRRAGVGVT